MYLSLGPVLQVRAYISTTFRMKISHLTHITVVLALIWRPRAEPVSQLSEQPCELRVVSHLMYSCTKGPSCGYQLTPKPLPIARRNYAPNELHELPAPCRWDSGALHHCTVTNGQTMGLRMLHSGSTSRAASDVPSATSLPVCSAVCCNCPRHDPSEASRYVLILLRRLDTCQNLLDANANLLATGAFLDLPNSAIGVIECARLLQDVRKFSL